MELTSPKEQRQQARAKALVAEKLKRKRLMEAFKADSFPEQWKAINDDAKLVSWLTTRRAGKSMGAAIKMLMTGVFNPGVTMLYTGLTEDSATRIIWKDCLKELGKRYKIKLRRVKRDLAIYMPDTESVIYIFGADNSSEEQNKVLGQKYKLVVVDEGAAYKQDTKALIEDIIIPATVDHNGQVLFCGMPNNNTNSYFFDVTTGNVPGWSIHKWTALDNPHVREQMKSHLTNMKKMNPGIEETASYRNNYLGEWCIDSSALVWKYSKSKNSISKLPEDTGYPWNHVVGVDFGWDDPTAFVVLAYRDYDPVVYVVEAYKRAQMTLSDVVERLKHYQKIYGVEKFVVDNADKQAVEEIKSRHGLQLRAADKAGKADFIQIINDDLVMGKVQLLRGRADALETEMLNLTWDEKARLKGDYKENKKGINHCSDAFIYPWRWCYAWVDRGVPKTPRHTAEEEVDLFWERESQKILRQQRGLEDYGYGDEYYIN